MGYLIGGAGPDADERKKIVASGKSSLKGMTDAQLRKMRGQAIKDISRFENNQMARKISLNSAYGAVGNQYFRYYKLANAEAITLSGQVSIRWIENKMNQKINKICLLYTSPRPRAGLLSRMTSSLLKGFLSISFTTQAMDLSLIHI